MIIPKSIEAFYGRRLESLNVLKYNIDQTLGNVAQSLHINYVEANSWRSTEYRLEDCCDHDCEHAVDHGGLLFQYYWKILPGQHSSLYLDTCADNSCSFPGIPE